jgi:peptidoglycan LD-endopeptidase LytH
MPEAAKWQHGRVTGTLPRMARSGLSRSPRSQSAHIAVWAVTGALLFTLLGSALPSGWGITPALAATSLQKAQADLAKAKKELRALQTRLDKLAKQQSDAEADLETTQDKIVAIQGNIDTTEKDLAGLKGQLAGRLAEMYKNRDSNAATFLSVLFSSEDTSLNTIVERLTLVSHIARADAQLIDSVQARLDELKGLKADLASEKASEKKKTAKYNAARDKTLASLESAKDDYNGLRKKVANLQAAARKAEEEARAAEAARKVAAANANKSKTTTTTQHKSTTTTERKPPVTADFVFPVDGPNSFSNTFGAPRSGGRTHEGCDIFTARNTPLVACVDGVITSTNPVNTGLGGITIHLRGGNRTVYYYAHLSSIASGIHAGVRVSAGDVIGYAGNTGNASGGAVHLHFEIRPNGGAAINPYPTLVKYR